MSVIFCNLLLCYLCYLSYVVLCYVMRGNWKYREFGNLGICKLEIGGFGLRLGFGTGVLFGMGCDKGVVGYIMEM